MTINYKKNTKFFTQSTQGVVNGYLIPVYNVHENFYPNGAEPKQVYVTAIAPGHIKGPHLHFIRTGCFTCIKGNVGIVLKVESEFQIYKSGEDYDYASILIPVGVPAAIKNLGDCEAIVLNMPFPAWTPDMNDEHTADFSDFNFNSLS